MQLRERNTIGVGSRIFVQDHVFAKSNAAIFTDLLVPREAVAVRIDGGYDVVETVAVDVINQHLSASLCEMKRMLGPNGIVVARSGLFPPAVLFNDVDATVPVNVAAPDAMGKSLVGTLGTHGVKFPRGRRVFPVRLRVTNIPF